MVRTPASSRLSGGTHGLDQGAGHRRRRQNGSWPATSTRAAYRSYLDKHFIPVFGRRPMGKILPTEVERWVTTATENGLSAPSVGNYHTMLHSVFERALRDRLVKFNPCAHTELPKRVKKKTRTLTPEEYAAIVAALPERHRLMVETAINTGLRSGELIALKPRHLDLTTGRHYGRGDHRRGLPQELPHRRPYPHQVLPQGQRTPSPWPSPAISSPSSPAGSASGASSR
jgi:integrase